MQKLTESYDFHSKDSEEKYKLLHETELRVQRLERLCIDFLTWKEGSDFYEESYKDFMRYTEGD